LRAPLPTHSALHSFPTRRSSDLQANLSTKLARAANLLRTRVDVELERQNRDLLTSMDRRHQLQLQLQATVEGLSVAAISYYVVRSEEHTSELQSRGHLVCRLLLE